MENALQPHPPEADPAAAIFAQLVDEVGVVRRLVAANDNTATLGEIVQRLDKLVEAIRVLSRRPAMTLTPDHMAEQITAAAVKARAEDQATIAQAKDRIEKAARLMESQGAKAVTAREQRRRLAWTGGVCLFAGALLMSFMPGWTAREMPASWHWPERMAAHVLGRDRWSAGERLLATADPEHWRMVVLGNSIVGENQEMIAKCLRISQKSGKPAACLIRTTVSR
jgi:hypothetical protein